MHGRIGADRNAYQHVERQRRQHQGQRQRHSLEHKLRGGLTGQHRVAKIAVQRAPEIAKILNGQRLIQSPLLAKGFQVGGASARSKNLQGRIS